MESCSETVLLANELMNCLPCRFMNLISAERIDARRDNSSSVRDVKYNLTGLKR